MIFFAARNLVLSIRSLVLVWVICQETAQDLVNQNRK